MSTADLRYRFAAPVLRQDTGFRHHYLPLPMDVADAFRDAGVRRLAGSLNGVSIRRAIRGRRDGERFLVVGQDLLHEIGAHEGDTVIADLYPDPARDVIDLPEELAVALEQDPVAARLFEARTIGFRRSVALYVEQGKRTETRVNRALEVAGKLRTDPGWGESRPRD